MRQHDEKFENFSEDLQLTKASADGGFTGNVSEGQFFLIMRNVSLEGYGTTSSCRQYTNPRSDERTYPKGFIRGNTIIGLVLDKRFSPHEIEIDSLMNDGPQSWDVINRGVEKYVTELAFDHMERIHSDEVSVHEHDENRCDKPKDTTAESVFIVILIDERCLANKPTTFEGHSLR